MFWVALEMSISKIGLNTLSLTAKKLDAFKFDGGVESDNTVVEMRSLSISYRSKESTIGIYVAWVGEVSSENIWVGFTFCYQAEWIVRGSRHGTFNS